MARKELAQAGLAALVGGVQRQAEPSKAPVEQAPVPVRPEQPQVIEERPMVGAPVVRQRGRPKGSVKSDVERRAVSCRIQEEHYRKLGAMARLAGCTRQDLMDVAYERLIASFERENGPVAVEDEVRFNVKF